MEKYSLLTSLRPLESDAMEMQKSGGEYCVEQRGGNAQATNGARHGIQHHPSVPGSI
jgi:hypothetical protein